MLFTVASKANQILNSNRMKKAKTRMSKLVSKAWWLGGHLIWTFATGAIVLAVPVFFEYERECGAVQSSRGQRARAHGSKMMSRRFASETTLRDFAGIEAFDNLLAEQGAVAAAQWALDQRRSYKENKVAWDPLLKRMAGPDQEERPFGYLKKMKMKEPPDLLTHLLQELLQFVKILAGEAQVTQSSFWDNVTQGTSEIYTRNVEDLEGSLELARLYATISAWHKEVFQAVFENVVDSGPPNFHPMREMRYGEIHCMEPEQLVHLLRIFSQAGAASVQLSGLATKAFNEARQRLEERGTREFCQEEDPETEWNDFSTQQMLSIIDSMARFSAQNNEKVLRKFGRARLHPGLMELPPIDVAKLCSAYSMLNFQHHTVFRQVVLAIFEEQEEEDLRFGSAEMALVLDAMLVLRLYRGNNPWFNWGERFQELLDIFMRRLETSTDLETMAARPLAAGAYALGRAKRGSETLCQKMMARMMTLLEKDNGDPDGRMPAEAFPSAPQETSGEADLLRPKDLSAEFLETEWLRDWMCNNYWKLSLHNIVRINRYLVQIRSFDKAYLEIFVEFFCENMDQLTKSDVMDLTHTYNHARLGEEDLELGRHFFWALGRQFQQQHVHRVAERTRRRRPALERIG
eukprot:g23710.t1